MEKHEIKISDYCKECAFLCKTDKEYCPNKRTPQEARRLAEAMYLRKMQNLYKTLKEEK